MALCTLHGVLPVTSCVGLSMRCPTIPAAPDRCTSLHDVALPESVRTTQTCTSAMRHEDSTGRGAGTEQPERAEVKGTNVKS